MWFSTLSSDKNWEYYLKLDQDSLLPLPVHFIILNSLSHLLVYMLRRWSIYLLIYSCCSHLERKPSLKRFVSFQFLNLRQSVGLLGRDQPDARPLPTHRTTQTQNRRKQAFMPRASEEFMPLRSLWLALVLLLLLPLLLPLLILLVFTPWICEVQELTWWR
jgi:hypothetical protein